MARRRMIDPTIWEDENFGKLNFAARVLFIGIVSNADDEGRLRASAPFLRSAVFVYDDIPTGTVEGLIKKLNDQMPSVHFYKVGGNEYCHLTKWETYQNQRAERRTASSLPSCPQCGDIMSDKGQTKDRKKSAQVKLSKVKLSKDKKEKHISYLLNIPPKDTEEFIKKFTCTEKQVQGKGEDLYNYCKAKGKRYSDYKAFLRNALKKDFGDRVETPRFVPEDVEVDPNGRQKIKEMKKKLLGKSPIMQ